MFRKIESLVWRCGEKSPIKPPHDSNSFIIPPSRSRQPMVVGSKCSCGALIERKQSAEAFETMLAEGGQGRADNCLCLGEAFEMVMFDELNYCTAQRRLTKEDHLRETLSFDRAYSALGERIQIVTAVGSNSAQPTGAPIIVE
jgi:hypothetical protein